MVFVRRHAMPGWLRGVAPVCLVFCLLAAGCAGGRRTSDPALAQAVRELAAGVEGPAIPGTGVLSHDSEERQVAPRVRRVASVRHGDVAGASSLSGVRSDVAVVDTAGSANVAVNAGAFGVDRAASPFFPHDLSGASSRLGVTDAASGLAGASSDLPFAQPDTVTGLSAVSAVPLEMATRPIPALWRRLALEAQEIFGLDAALVLAVIRAESSFNAKAVSSAGAEGAMQIMPRTQEELGLIDPFDPRANVYAGAQYLMEQLQRFGSVELALAAYNAGPASVERYGGIPPYAETQEYVRRVLAYWEAGRRDAGLTSYAGGQSADEAR